MRINEKIVYCRKKAGLSQEALAEKLGVSRQAISKWETGDAAPETSKLLSIAKTFGVSTDWLLSEDDIEEESTKENEKTFESTTSTSHQSYDKSRMDSVPGFIGRLLRRYGWLVGIYISAIGTGLIGIGGLSRYMVRRMFSNSSFDPMGGMDSFVNGFDTQMNDVFLLTVDNNPVYTMGMFFIILGLIMLVVGIVIAVVLKKKSRASS